MVFRSRFWVILVVSLVVWATLVGAGAVRAAPAPPESSVPLASAWNITSSGTAANSGELQFRLVDDRGDDLEITVFVLSGTNETGVASSIRRALSNQLDANRFEIDAGEGANVLLSADSSKARFSVELVDSDVDNVSVTVQNATPVAPPTVPQQQQPATPPAVPSQPTQPGEATPPAGEQPPLQTPGTSPPTSASPTDNAPASNDPSIPPENPAAPPIDPSVPPPGSSTPPAQPTAPGTNAPASGGAGAPGSAPPPPPGG